VSSKGTRKIMVAFAKVRVKTGTPWGPKDLNGGESGEG